MLEHEQAALQRAIAQITEIAQGFGLDFYPMRYEICPSDIIYTFGSYGMPTRFSHWSFGKAFHRMKLSYDLGLSKIYELVINSNPCYAFLLDGNSLIQNKLIVAHVLGHCDFFKNNIRFSQTSRDMVESMAAGAERIRQYEIQYGKETVEAFLDAVLAIQEHVDPSLLRRRYDQAFKQDKAVNTPHKPYDDLWNLDQTDKKKDEGIKVKRFPEKPVKDLLQFLEYNSKYLLDWQRDILTLMREEMLYFWPQLETKIMNEGWASYWHSRILRELDLDEDEIIEFAKLNASVIQPSRSSINPYYLGLKIFEDIEHRWDNPTERERQELGREPGQGRKKIFEIREVESDSSFIRNYLTQQLVEDLDLYLFQRNGNDWTIVDKNWESVRDQLVAMRVNGGYPYLMVEDGDYLRNGELYMKHYYEGTELDVKYIEKTLPHVHHIWGRTIHLETVIEDRSAIFSYDGKKHYRRFV